MAVHLDTDRDRFRAFRAMEHDGPVHMLNLVRLRERAEYEDGRAATGAEAYAAYGRESGPIFRRVGGRIVWSGEMKLMVIGPDDLFWDLAFIAEYPDSDAFVEMVKDPAYQIAVKHRQAAVADSRLIRFHPKDPGAAFGE